MEGKESSFLRRGKKWKTRSLLGRGRGGSNWRRGVGKSKQDVKALGEIEVTETEQLYFSFLSASNIMFVCEL